MFTECSELHRVGVRGFVHCLAHCPDRLRNLGVLVRRMDRHDRRTDRQCEAPLGRRVHPGVVLDHQLVDDRLELVHVLLRHGAESTEVEVKGVPIAG